MKFNTRILGLSLFLGIVSWILDAVIGSVVFGRGTFWEMVIMAVPAEELVHRVFVLVLLLSFGFIISNILFRREEAERATAKRTLEESERRFRELAELLPESVFEADIDFRVTYANQKAFELFGYTQEDFDKGLSGLQMLTPAGQKRAQETIKRRLEGHEPGVMEYTAVRKDGSTFPILFHAALDRVEGRPDRVRGVIVDITERIRSEEGLRESERRFRNIVESSPMGVFLYQLQSDGRLVFAAANPAADQILGTETSGFVGKTIEEAFPPLAETEVPDRYREAAANGTPWNSQQIDYAHGGISGAYEVSAFQTAPNEVAVMFLDITERKKAEEAIRESEERFRGVIEQLGDATYILFDGRFDLVNPRFCELTGITPEEAAAPDFEFWRLVAPGSVPIIRKRLEQRERGEEVPGIYEFDVQHKDGHVVQVEASVTEIDYRGGKAVLGLLRDITEQKSLKEQLLLAQKMESIGRLSGGVAHDLNNMLTPVIGYGDLVLSDFSLEDERRDSILEILQAAFRARDLVRQLLAFGRQQPMDFKAIDLNEMVDGFQGLLKRAISKDIEIRFLPSPVKPTIRGDRGQLEQVIMNLAVNAQDAMPTGGLLTIETSEVELDGEYSEGPGGLRAGHYALLSVSDTGQGMDAETRDKIFEPFFTTKEKGKGTGLGLATVYGIVKQHEGNIWAYSEPAQGTSFYCYLPLADAAAPEPLAPVSESRDLDGTETIMVVEDEATVRHLAAKVLKRHGYQVLEAEDSRSCLALLQDHQGPLDLLLTDVVMPGMDGRELFGKVQGLFSGVRVLYMSGYTQEIITSRGKLDIGIPFLQKPFSVQGLVTRVRGVLEEG